MPIDDQMSSPDKADPMASVLFLREYFDHAAGKYRKKGEYARVSAEQAEILIRGGAAQLVDLKDEDNPAGNS